MKPKRRYLRMVFHEWKAIKATSTSEPVSMQETRSSGFIQVYDTLRDLRKDHGRKAKYTTIETRETT